MKKYYINTIGSTLLVVLIISTFSLFAQPFPGKIGVGLDAIGGKALEFPNVTLTAVTWQSVANGGDALTDNLGWPFCINSPANLISC